jgi:hypothetical protein
MMLIVCMHFGQEYQYQNEMTRVEIVAFNSGQGFSLRSHIMETNDKVLVPFPGCKPQQVELWYVISGLSYHQRRGVTVCHIVGDEEIINTCKVL